MDTSRLVRATNAAARHLAARGAVAQADGITFQCTYADGRRAVVRNTSQSVPTFSEARLIDQIANGIVRAFFARS